MCVPKLNYNAFTVVMSVAVGRPAATLPAYETMIERMTSFAIDRHDRPFVDRALHMMVVEHKRRLRDVTKQKNGTHTRVTRRRTHNK